MQKSAAEKVNEVPRAQKQGSWGGRKCSFWNTNRNERESGAHLLKEIKNEKVLILHLENWFSPSHSHTRSLARTLFFFSFFRIIKNNSVAAFQRRVFFIPSTPSRRVAQLKITIGSFQIRAALCSNDGGQVVLTPAPQTGAIYFVFPHWFPALFMVWEKVDIFSTIRLDFLHFLFFFMTTNNWEEKVLRRLLPGCQKLRQFGDSPWLDTRHLKQKNRQDLFFF